MRASRWQYLVTLVAIVGLSGIAARAGAPSRTGPLRPMLLGALPDRAVDVDRYADGWSIAAPPRPAAARSGSVVSRRSAVAPALKRSARHAQVARISLPPPVTA